MNAEMQSSIQALETLRDKVIDTVKPLPDLAERVRRGFIDVLQKLDPTSEKASVSDAVTGIMAILNDIDRTSGTSKKALDREVLFPILKEIGKVTDKIQAVASPAPAQKYHPDYDPNELGFC